MLRPSRFLKAEALGGKTVRQVLADGEWHHISLQGHITDQLEDGNKSAGKRTQLVCCTPLMWMVRPRETCARGIGET